MGLRLCLSLLVAALGGCAGIPAGTLEFKNVQGFSVEKLEGTERTLRITGLCGASSAAISRVDIVNDGDRLIVLPKLVLAHGNLTGNLSVVLKVPANIHHVLFGEEGREIWPDTPPPPIRPKSQEELLHILAHPPENRQVELF